MLCFHYNLERYVVDTIPNAHPNQESKVDKLKNYVAKQLQAGLQPNEVTTQLRQAGWDEETIQQAFSLVQAQIAPTPAAATQEAVGVTSVVPQTATFGKKRGRIKTGWLLLKQSLKVLKNNEGLVRYVLM